VTPNPTRLVLACAAACALAAGAAQAVPQTQAQQPSPMSVTAKAGDGSSVPGRPVRLRASAGVIAVWRFQPAPRLLEAYSESGEVVDTIEEWGGRSRPLV